MLEVLEKEGEIGSGRCDALFGGDVEGAKRAVDLNFYLGFGGIITFKNSGALKVALDVPAERLLLETDCPFLAPVPKRGKRNEPAYVRYVAECLADAGYGDTGDVCRQTTQNAQALFGLTS